MKPFYYFISFSLFVGCLPTSFNESKNTATQKKESETFTDGFYGLSPTNLAVVWSRVDPWKSYKVFHNLGGVDEVLETYLSENRVVGLSPNSYYNLSLYGQDSSFALSNSALMSFGITTWESFARAGKIDLDKIRDAGGADIGGLRISIDYDPFAQLRPGPGVAQKTFAECRISDASIDHRINPWNDSAAVSKKILLSQKQIEIRMSEIDFRVLRNVACKVIYADGTESVLSGYKPFQSNFVAIPAPCSQTSVSQGENFNCEAKLLNQDGDELRDAGLVLDMERTTCSWKNNMTMSGTESDTVRTISALVDKNAHVAQSCDLVYRAKKIDHLDFVNKIRVINREPTLELREKNISTGALIAMKQNTIVVPENTDYSGVVPNFFGAEFDLATKEIKIAAPFSNEAGDNLTFANVSIHPDPNRRLTSGEPCDNHFKSSNLNSLTGEMRFTFHPHFFGRCKIKLEVDDATGATNARKSQELSVTVYPVNDAPSISFMAAERLASENDIERCAKKASVASPTSEADFLGCVVSVEQRLNLSLLRGGSEPSGKSPVYYVESNDNVVPGQIVVPGPGGIKAFAVSLYTPPQGETVAHKKNDGSPLTASSIWNLSGSPSTLSYQLTTQDTSSNKADFLLSLSGGSTLQFTPQNPDVSRVGLNISLSDSGYSSVHINALQRDASEIIYNNTTKTLFDARSADLRIYVQVGEYLSRYTDLHVVYDTSSMGVSVIDAAKAAVDKWYNEELLIKLSPRHINKKVYHRRLMTERWVSSYPLYSALVAYGNVEAYGVTRAPDGTSSSNGVLKPVDPFEENLDTHANALGNQNFFSIPSRLSAYGVAHLESSGVLRNKEIMMISFCDEASNHYNGHEFSRLENRSSLSGVNISHPYTSNIGTRMSLFDITNDRGVSRLLEDGTRLTNGSFNGPLLLNSSPTRVWSSNNMFSVINKFQIDQYSVDHDVFKRLHAQLRAFRGISYPMIREQVRPRNFSNPLTDNYDGGTTSSPDFLIHTMAAMWGTDGYNPSLNTTVEEQVKEFMDYDNRNPALTQAEWNWVKDRLVDMAAQADFVELGNYRDGLKKYNWVGKWNKIAYGINHDSINLMNRTQSSLPETFPYNDFVRDMEILRFK